MKIKILLVFLTMISFNNMTLANDTMNLYDFSFEDIDGNQVNLEKFTGKPLLIVNTASRCGFTPQYTNLQNLFLEYKNTDLTIIATTSNSFSQEYESSEEIKKICDRHNLYMIEDCAQSHFSEYKDLRAGLWGDIGTFSFYPGKNLGAYGDAGCVITSNELFSKKIRMLANHGALIKHEHKLECVNSRLDGIQAAILNVKLKYILEWTVKRKKIANYLVSYRRSYFSDNLGNRITIDKSIKYFK